MHVNCIYGVRNRDNFTVYLFIIVIVIVFFSFTLSLLLFFLRSRKTFYTVSIRYPTVGQRYKKLLKLTAIHREFLIRPFFQSLKFRPQNRLKTKMDGPETFFDNELKSCDRVTKLFILKDFMLHEIKRCLFFLFCFVKICFCRNVKRYENIFLQFSRENYLHGPMVLKNKLVTRNIPTDFLCQ